MTLYPLLMHPYFRSGAETPWGGNMLRDAFLKTAPERTGESLEISALPGLESIVRNGDFAGLPLSRVFEDWGEALTGAPGGFPLLLKLIDTRERTSVQVHPGDGYAQEHEGGKPGGSKAWLVLNCEPGAKLACGLNPDCPDALERIMGGGAEEALNWIEVRPGDVYEIPSGLVHAIGPGIQLYEIQQNSDLAYRLWDWNRVNPDGEPRALHREQAASMIDASLRPAKLRGVTSLCRGGSRTYYISNKHFELCRLNVSGSMPVCDGRMHFLTPLACCKLRWGDELLELLPFESVLIPAAFDGAALESDDCKVLMSSLPNQAALRAELGYRAEDVAGLC